ncbi:MAG: hypothetical protein L3K10_03630 [Thermoplasmata archaeon]|nr:hypothetical protein [Thermoplasmata archaeon]
MNPPPDRSIPTRQIVGGGPRVSLLGMTVTVPSIPSPVADRSIVERLRTSRRAGVSTFDVAGAVQPDRAERLVAQAFPQPDSDLVVIVGRTRDDLVPQDEDQRRSVPRESSAVDRLRFSLEGSRRRLHPHGPGVVEWISSANDPPTLRGPAPLGPASTASVLWFRNIDDLGPDSPVFPEGGHDPLRVAGALSLLEPRLVRRFEDPDRGASVSVLARDPFAGGRLDGTRFSHGGLERSPDRGPTRLRDLESEFAPVLGLAFLTEGRHRTLAQTALRYSAHWPWVASVLVPLPSADRIVEVLGTFGTPVLTEEELRRLDRRPAGALSPSEAVRRHPLL